jgi:hypothetical protein
MFVPYHRDKNLPSLLQKENGRFVSSSFELRRTNIQNGVYRIGRLVRLEPMYVVRKCKYRYRYFMLNFKIFK